MCKSKAEGVEQEMIYTTERSNQMRHAALGKTANSMLGDAKEFEVVWTP